MSLAWNSDKYHYLIICYFRFLRVLEIFKSIFHLLVCECLPFDMQYEDLAANDPEINLFRLYPIVFVFDLYPERDLLSKSFLESAARLKTRDRQPSRRLCDVAELENCKEPRRLLHWLPLSPTTLIAMRWGDGESYTSCAPGITELLFAQRINETQNLQQSVAREHCAQYQKVARRR